MIEGTRIVKTDFLYPFLLKYPLLPSLALWRSEESSLFAKLKLEEPILDLGCGNGYFASVALNAKVHAGCDSDFAQIKHAKMSDAYRHALVADICDLPYKDRSFATITSNCVLEHVQDLGRALREVYRVLAPGGLFIFTVPTDRFDEWFYLSWLLNSMRLHRLAKSQIKRYNHHQFHYNIQSVREWSGMLQKTGLHVEKYQYYASRVFVIVFSMLDDLAHIAGSLVRVKKTSSEDRSSRMGKQLIGGRFSRLMARLWWYLLNPLYGRRLPIDFEGAAVLVQARKSPS